MRYNVIFVYSFKQIAKYILFIYLSMMLIITTFLAQSDISGYKYHILVLFIGFGTFFSTIVHIILAAWTSTSSKGQVMDMVATLTILRSILGLVIHLSLLKIKTE